MKITIYGWSSTRSPAAVRHARYPEECHSTLSLLQVLLTSGAHAIFYGVQLSMTLAGETCA